MNKLVTNTSVYTIGRILPKAASMVLLPIYTKYLTPNDYGIISSMGVLGSIIVVFFTLSIERSVIRLYYEYETEEEKKTFLGTVTLSIWMISTLIVLLLFLFSKYVGLTYRSISFYPFYAITILATFVNIFNSVPMIYMALKGQALKFVLLSMSQFILNSGIILWFILVQKDGAIGVLKANLYSTVVFLPYFIVFSFKICKMKFKYEMFKNAFNFSFPIVPAILTGWVLTFSDRVFIERYYNLSDVGIYSMAYQIAALIGLFTSSFGTAYDPLFFKLANHQDQKLAQKKIFNYNELYLIIVILICFCLSFFAKEVVSLILDKKYVDVYLFVPIISFSYLFVSAGTLTSHFFQQSKKMKPNMYISIFTAILNTILNFLLIVPFGTYGAAYSTVISFGVGWYISYYYCKKSCYFVPISWKIIIPMVFSLSLLVILFQYFINVSLIISLIMKTTFLIVIGFYVFNKYYPRLKSVLSN